MLRGEISIARRSLNLKMMLEGGQSFRWRETAPSEWTGTFSNMVWTIKQFDDFIAYNVKGGFFPHQNKDMNGFDISCNNLPNVDQADVTKLLSSYLRLEDPVEKYYDEWSKKDPNFKEISIKCFGIRILNQDPVENVFSFICSSNNNIKRISSLVEKLCKLFGPKLCVENGTEYYGFPEISALAASHEGELRNAGFGYRAKFITGSAKLLESFGGLEWLQKLKTVPYSEAKSELMKLPGIGAKVADCICLMSLGHMEALPVDTHVYQIASQVYMPHLKKVKNVTDRIYNEIGDHFRDLYGPLAGWAHTVLFCGDLKIFKDVKNPTKMENTKVKKLTASANDNYTEDELGHIRKKTKSSNSLGHLPKKSKTKLSTNEETSCVSGILRCARRDLNLKITLNSGQTYRFKEIEKDVWRGVFASRVWTLRQFDDHLKFTAHGSSDTSLLVNQNISSEAKSVGASECEQLLFDYFRLQVPLKSYYKRWAENDKHFNEISDKFYGLRMIKQDIVENLFTFICSSCNTISRMTLMVETMCSLYGRKIAEVDNIVYFDFPSVYKLAPESVEKDLVNAHFGYRAKYIQQAAKYIVENGGDLWFDKLKGLVYEEAKHELMKLPGVAAKVADCICLTALDHLETIPVDTHVFQIAKRYYLPHLNSKKSISTQTYNEIGKCFRNIFGHYSGWAHTVLFASDLRQHKELHS